MFLPKSLDEAILWLDQHGVKGVTVNELLRLGYINKFQICLPLTESAYSPLKNHELFNKNISAGLDVDIQKIHEASFVDLYGLYQLPPKTLFQLEAEGEATAEIVFSLDKGEQFTIHKIIKIDNLRVTYPSLKNLISHIVKPTPTKQTESTIEAIAKNPPLQQRFQENEILRVICELGFTATKLPQWRAGKGGVKAQVRSKLKFPVKVFNKAWERLRADGSIKE